MMANVILNNVVIFSSILWQKHWLVKLQFLCLHNYYYIQDYPSVGHISYLLQQFDIIPVFAAETRAQPFYEASDNFSSYVLSVLFNMCLLSSFVYTES